MSETDDLRRQLAEAMALIETLNIEARIMDAMNHGLDATLTRIKAERDFCRSRWQAWWENALMASTGEPRDDVRDYVEATIAKSIREFRQASEGIGGETL